MSNEPSVHVGYYAVCIVDLLGQQSELAAWSKLPQHGQLTPELLSAIQKTAGRVQLFKKNFVNLFQQFAAISLTAEQQQLLEAKRPGLFKRFKTWPLRTQQFSDTFVFYCPMTNEQGDTSIQAIYRMLAACGIAVFGSLADKVALRGAICIGTGMELEVGNFYGPALASAHHLESKVAKYPRVIVSDEVVNFLKQQSGFSDDPDIDALLQIMARTSEMMVYQDDDSRHIVDFLGPAMRHFSDGKAVAAAESVRQFVTDESTRFAGIDEELANRYQRLKRYVEARMPLWRA